MGEQYTPEAVGKEVGVRADLRRGHPTPREIKSQKIQMKTGHNHGGNKAVKLAMKRKVRGGD
ncbi:MAG: hypothetical protein GX050_07725 [Firmicutes bacterium]|nr:hypothetical protein [Bacillota bacterium]